MELVKFNELEEKVKSIIKEYALLKKRNEELEVLLKSKDGELEEVRNKIGMLNEERDSVRTKVDSLLNMLHGIEI